jgi:hypothetical protein
MGVDVADERADELFKEVSKNDEFVIASCWGWFVADAVVAGGISSGTKWGVRLDIGGKIGLADHW